MRQRGEETAMSGNENGFPKNVEITKSERIWSGEKDWEQANEAV